EGMWVYNNLPVDQLKKRYGFEPDDAWTQKLMKASVWLNVGGSGSFVSPHGLVLTNHHVASDALHKISEAGKNYHDNGFLASSREDEIPLKDLEIIQLVSIEDVTQRVKNAVRSDMDAAAAAAARRVIMAG